MSAWEALFSGPTAALAAQEQLAKRPLLGSSADPPSQPHTNRGGRGGGRGGRGGGRGGSRGGSISVASSVPVAPVAGGLRPLVGAFAARRPNPPAPAAATPTDQHTNKTNNADNKKRPLNADHTNNKQPTNKKQKRSAGSGSDEEDDYSSFSSLMQPVESPAEIAAWIAERKKKFPTATVIAAKEAAHAAAVARGEVVDSRRGGRGGHRGGAQRGGRLDRSSDKSHSHTHTNSHRSQFVLEEEEDGENGDSKRTPSSSPTSAPSSASAVPRPASWKSRPCHASHGPRGCPRPVAECPYRHKDEPAPVREKQPWLKKLEEREARQKQQQQEKDADTTAAPTTSTDAPAAFAVVPADSASSASVAPAAPLPLLPSPPPATPAPLDTPHSAITSVAPTNAMAAAAAIQPDPTHTDTMSAVEVNDTPDATMTPDLTTPTTTVTTTETPLATTSMPTPPIEELQPNHARRVLQAIRFLITRGPLRQRSEEQMEE